jgi:hypothetical protein
MPWPEMQVNKPLDGANQSLVLPARILYLLVSGQGIAKQGHDR